MHAKSKNAFTLAELLVVVSIIALLIALLLPTLNKARYVSRLAVCASNLREIHIGLLTYATEYARWYPTNGTDWVIRGTTYGFPKDQSYGGVTIKETAYKELATYYGWPEKDRKGLTYRNKLWRCPQGWVENEERSYYSVFSDTWAGISFASYVGPFPAPRSIDTPENMMRKVGDRWKMAHSWRRAPGYPANPEYNILASDINHRVGHSGGGISTNHMWGDTREDAPHYAPLGIKSFSNEASANYLFDDGSVVTYGPFDWPAMGVPAEFNIGGLGGVGCDPYAVPAEWGQY